MDGSCKLGGGSLVYTCVELRNTLELLKNEEESNSCIKKSYIYKIWSYSIVVVGENAHFCGSRRRQNNVVGKRDAWCY